MFLFMSLVAYMGVLKCRAFTDYWRGDKLYSLPFPEQVMTRKTFFEICQALHLSSSAVDAANEQKKGTPAFGMSLRDKAVLWWDKGGLQKKLSPQPEHFRRWVNGCFKSLPFSGREPLAQSKRSLLFSQSRDTRDVLWSEGTQHVCTIC